MIEALDEITEIPFIVFWDKFMELEPGIYDRYIYIYIYRHYSYISIYEFRVRAGQ